MVVVPLLAVYTLKEKALTKSVWSTFKNEIEEEATNKFVAVALVKEALCEKKLVLEALVVVPLGLPWP